MSASVLPGGNASFAITVYNDAVIDRTARMDATSVPASWTYGYSVDALPVPANGKNMTSLVVSVPPDATPGRYAIRVEARDQLSSDWAHTNVTVTVQERPPSLDTSLGPPQLRVTPPAGAIGVEGDIVSGSLRIENLDHTRHSVQVTVTPRSKGAWAPYLPSAYRQFLGPGETVDIPLAVRVPALAQNTSVDLEIVVALPDHPAVSYHPKWSVEGRVADRSISPADSTAPTPTSSTPSSASGSGFPRPAGTGPGLQILVDPLELTIASGGTQTLRVRLENDGGVPLSVSLVATPPPEWPNLVFDPAELALAPGEVSYAEATVSAPAGIPAGGTTQADVSAIADGLLRRATFKIVVVPGSPSDQTVAARVDAPVSPTPGDESRPSLLFGVGLAAVGAGAVVMLNRPLREKALWLGLGLYTRLARPDVLGHQDRERLYRLVETTPGIHFHALQRDLGWNTGTLTYHLRVLERHGFLVSRRDGLYRRFYLAGAAPRKETFENQGPTGLRADVIEAVRNTPGISQSDLALGLGANKQTVNYHVKALERAGTIRVEKRGRDTFLYPADAPTAGVDPAHA